MNEVHPTNRNEVAWTSWLPAVGFALARSTGPVLEIGIGHFSTPFLHEYCKGAGRHLASAESDRKWMDAFIPKYFGDHKFVSVDQATPKTFSHARFGVVFIDNSPGGQARAIPFKNWINSADFIVDRKSVV